MKISSRAKPDSPASSITSVPSFDRTKKPTAPATQSKDYGLTDHLRPVVIPAALLSSFLVLAQRNTDMNVETCGILAGRLIRSLPGSLTLVRQLLLSRILELTHPSQTAFLSSVDLHTHCSYQLMMPEAIAIVCAPKHNE
ncbi:STAM-binding protein-like A [Diaphorina citri]|uniref:STAM-binding protein-like A n=1 Tax=Diaphorina citri TaxID=121845 RepID=A0A3Q0JNI9_DIACI|nr:STAM-binding protein-like A [Diaphorina citri]